MEKFTIKLIIVIGILASGVLYVIFTTEQDSISNITNQETIEETEQEIVIHESMISAKEDTCIGNCP